MKQKISAGDKLTCIRVNEMASTTITEITIDSIAEDGRAIYAQNRKRYYLKIDHTMIILRGHNLGITQGSWGENGSKCMLMDANCNIGGLDRESMVTLLKTNINPEYNEWHYIRWYDGTSEEGEAIFSTTPAVNNIVEPIEEAEVVEEIEPIASVEQSATKTEPLTEDYSYLTPVANRFDKKAAATNLRKLLKRSFPETKFSVKNDHAYYYSVHWVDGPTVEMVNKVALKFEGGRFDSMADYIDHVHTEFTNKYGWLESVLCQRQVSEKYQTEELNLLNKERGTSYKMNDLFEGEIYCVRDVIYNRTRLKDYTIKVEPKPITPIVSVGLEIQDYSDKSFVVIGDTKPVKELLKSLGGRFNGLLRCGAGWVFKKSQLETVKAALSIA